MNYFERLDSDDDFRHQAFPVTRKRIFLAHAAITVLPAVVEQAMHDFNHAYATGDLDFTAVHLSEMDAVRESAAQLIGASANEIALLGPTSLGLNLVANGLDWQAGDEVVCYLDDYPANVYPWQHLQEQGVKVIYLQPEQAGEITPDLVASVLTSRTKLVSLASCHFLTGYRIDIDTIGRLLHDHQVLFCLDAIQTCGAFPIPIEHVDFLCADSHKWMLGPAAAGIFYVKEKHFPILRPTLHGAWNVKCPDFIAKTDIQYEPGGRRYEPGVLNFSGLLGMKAGLNLINDLGVENIAQRILSLKEQVVAGLEQRDCPILPPTNGATATGITTFFKQDNDWMRRCFRHLSKNQIAVSLRNDRQGQSHIRISHHFYNTSADFERLFACIDEVK
ncbi:MAG: aminotransferase class V-fold PLP-dependent enzyme [Verrucomicrobiales bacterium]|nr:aminotransferase class V-fold PLP-dependent enzyme [Verrucomicrobiales bacterium]